MTKQYEYVTLDAGHEYTQPCEVLLETEMSYFIKLGGNECIVGKNSTRASVREVKEKIDVYTLLSKVASDTDDELCGESEVSSLGDEWVKYFADKLIKAGALKEGMYEL